MEATILPVGPSSRLVARYTPARWPYPPLGVGLQPRDKAMDVAFGRLTPEITQRKIKALMVTPDILFYLVGGTGFEPVAPAV